MSRRRTFVVPLATLLLSACAKTVPPISVCTEITFEDRRFTDCVATPGKQEIGMALAGKTGKPLRSLTALKASREGAGAPPAFATNGGMFDDAGQPVGLYIEDGTERRALNRRRGPGNFHLMPNGVFSVEADGWHLRTTQSFAGIDRKLVRFATQSGPMLLIEGDLHPRISKDGPSRNVRNAVGIDAAGRAHFVISSDPVSFGQLARLYRDKLGCRDALFLDGFVSSLWDPASARMDAGPPLGPMIIVENTLP